MKRLVLAAVAALLSTAAGAADLPLKAAPKWSLGAYPTLNGVIVGLYTEGGGSSVTASIPGVPPASLTTTTAAIGVTLGYMWTPRNSPVTFSVEGDVCAQNFNGNTAGFSLQGPICLEQRVMAFAPWEKLLAAVPSIPNPFSAISPFAFQSGVTPVGNAVAGIGFGFYERDISTAFMGVQSGKVWRVEPLSNGTALRGGIKIDFPSQGKIFGATPAGFTSATLGEAGVRAFIGAAF